MGGSRDLDCKISDFFLAPEHVAWWKEASCKVAPRGCKGGRPAFYIRASHEAEFRNRLQEHIIKRVEDRARGSVPSHRHSKRARTLEGFASTDRGLRMLDMCNPRDVSDDRERGCTPSPEDD